MSTPPAKLDRNALYGGLAAKIAEIWERCEDWDDFRAVLRDRDRLSSVFDEAWDEALMATALVDAIEREGHL